MVEGIYNSAASLSVLEKWQANISQNLAASNVAGFKKADFAIKTDDQKKTKYEPDGITAAQHVGGLPVNMTSINFSAGDMKATGKPTDLAIEGPGFFRIKDTDGQFLYTRDGEFQLNAENTVVTKGGLPVIADGSPITVDPDKGPIFVARDGTISQGDNQLGNLVLYDFENPRDLIRVEGGFFQAPPGTDAQPVEKIAVSQGSIEASNVVPMQELINLIAVSRAYEASQRTMTSQDNMLSQAINSLGTTTA
jgi:flagellar basal body rod protein FlgG